MNHATASQMIAQERHRSGSAAAEPDGMVAHRAERRCLKYAFLTAGVGIYFLLDDYGKCPPFIEICLFMELIATLGFCWLAWRFNQVRRLLVETQTNLL